MNAIDYYVMFVALQRHFRGSYDYFKYNGKIRISNATFNKNEYTCNKLKKKYSITEFKWLCISNLMKKPDIWITDLLNEQSEELYHTTRSNIFSLRYNFQTDLSTLSSYGNFNDVLNPIGGELPISYKLAKVGEIKLESLIILDRLVNIFEVWRKYEDVISSQYLDCWKKYSKFIDIPDIVVYKKLVLSSCVFVDKNV